MYIYHNYMKGVGGCYNVLILLRLITVPTPSGICLMNIPFILLLFLLQNQSNKDYHNI